MSDSTAVGPLVEHLFRHAAGGIVATLTRLLGPARLDVAEEVVQEAMIRALETWPHRGVPDDPAAWLARVARNRALDRLRHETLARERLDAWDPATAPPAHGRSGPTHDDELAMILMCCHPFLPPDQRVALTLKSVGGFSVDEIARAFLARREAIAQRIVRAKRRLREDDVGFGLPPPEELGDRLDSVLEVLYLMFNEGWEATEGDALIRRDLCGEALRLVHRLAEHPATARPETHALLALMLLHASRLEAREHPELGLLLLSEQDRSRWDRQLIAEGHRAIERAAAGTRLTRYHLEAGVAAVHAAARSWEQTDWPAIVRLYDALLDLAPTPVVALNRAVAVSMVHGPEAGLESTRALEAEPALAGYFLLPATLAELSLRCGDAEAGRTHFEAALGLARTEPERRFLRRRLDSIPIPP